MKRFIHRKDKDGLDPVRMANDFEVAWAAGVYEGEGSCVRSGHGQRSFVAQMAQKDPDVLYRLRDLFGGLVTERNNNRSQLVRKGEHATIYTWQLCGDRARIFLTAIYPYLTPRRKAQIDNTQVIEFRIFVRELPRTDIIPFLNSQIELWIEMHRKDSARRRRESFARFDAKRSSNDEMRAHRNEVRRATRARRKAETHKEGN
jgi:hypothetical protein